MLDALRRALERDPDVANALLFGSTDVAVQLTPDSSRDVFAVGGLAARLESAAGRPISLVLLDEAPPPRAYRIFRDGQLVVERDHAALVARKTRAILDYLDFKPVEELCAAGVLRAAARRKQTESETRSDLG
jgi:predicted nucleotidyltransferase